MAWLQWNRVPTTATIKPLPPPPPLSPAHQPIQSRIDMDNVLHRNCTSSVFDGMTPVESCSHKSYFKDKYIRCCTSELCNDEGSDYVTRGELYVHYVRYMGLRTRSTYCGLCVYAETRAHTHTHIYSLEVYSGRSRHIAHTHIYTDSYWRISYIYFTKSPCLI